MAKSAITLAAPPADEAADALLSTKRLIKPKKSGSIKGVLAGAAAVSFALGLAAMLACGITIPCMAPNAPRRVVGQWGGAGGASCEDHFALAGSVRVAAACTS